MAPAIVAAVLALLAISGQAFATGVADDEPGVYLKLIEGATLPFDDVARQVEESLATSGWTVVTRTDCGVDASVCSFRSRVIVAYTARYLERVMAHGPHAAFAVPIRFVVWQDENGVNVGATNPMNLNRTIVDETTEPGDWADVAQEIRAVTPARLKPWAVVKEYGQERDKARIGRTMGIMAGGKFTDKLKDVLVRPAGGDTPRSVADRLVGRLASVPGDWTWGIRASYVIELPGEGMVILGVTGDEMEARSFGIVAHGGDDARKKMACPGIDHAAAYPVEVTIAVVGGELQIRLVDEMYRMKMFFEDAGKMAFAKNMGMPGSIEDEIKDKIRAVLNP
jgi:uncharacterized protein (DUF302 family)